MKKNSESLSVVSKVERGSLHKFNFRFVLGTGFHDC